MTSRRISLRKRSPDDVPVAAPAPSVGQAGHSERVSLGKGRPTPKRSEAERRRGGPVPPPPTTRREAAKRLREQQSQDRKQVRAATVSHDQTKMLPRDAGPVRADVRDLVDGRRNAGVIMLPIALAFVLAQLTRTTAVLSVASRLFTLGLLLVIADFVVTGTAIRRAVRTQHPTDTGRGHVFYGLLRSTVWRRLRMPPTRVSPPPLLKR